MLGNNLPKIRVITLHESIDRQNNFSKQFDKINYTNYNFIKFNRFSKKDITVLHGEQLHENSFGTASSHLWNMKDWYDNTEEPYLLVMEDDISLITLNYWGFTLEEFMDNLPKSWEAIQLTWIGYYEKNKFYLRRREIDDFGLACYALKRSYVKKLIDKHVLDSWTFTLKMQDRLEQLPIIENVVLDTTNPNVLIFPLFIEDIVNTTTTYRGTELQVVNGQGVGHVDSYHQILNSWKKYARQPS